MTLPELLKSHREIQERATPGPWTAGKGMSSMGVHIDARANVVAYALEATKENASEAVDAPFIAASREAWPACTAALLKAVEALEFYKDKVTAGDCRHFGEWGLEPGQRARQALAEIRRLMGAEG